MRTMLCTTNIQSLWKYFQYIYYGTIGIKISIMAINVVRLDGLSWPYTYFIITSKGFVINCLKSFPGNWPYCIPL